MRRKGVLKVRWQYATIVWKKLVHGTLQYETVMR